MTFTYHTPQQSDELKQLGDILVQCFNALDEPVFLNRIGIDNTRILKVNDRIVGGLGLLSLGQWYNGANIPMVGVAGVGIAPEYRGKGTAIALMQSVLQELYAKEIPISVLFSAAQPLYRKAGYEQAGALCNWEVSTDSIQSQKHTLEVRSLNLDSDLFAELYNQQAHLNQGFLDRNSMIWDVIKHSEPRMYAYQFENEGYIIFQQQQDCLVIRDWVLLTPAAVRQFWTFLANHRSQIARIEWKSSPVDALSLCLPDQTAKIKWLRCWLLRIVHLQNALQQRNYPNISAELHLDIQDSILSNNQGKFVLIVENGRGVVTSGGRGDLQLEIRSLSPLYTGLFTAEQLVRSSLLTGTSEAIQTATQIFASPTPWMPDFF
ncbi:MAG: GNAT family N-acetyltransferase [Phormidium tanganyikae FI6-MK23]|jgi:predicted acetyltransferase|nr:GNAT family N-acetyltransferase [Phormidium tanganyikae FI6-MK23]